MGDLANKQISQTYDGLIQTGTDNPIDGTLRPLQDGSGNNLPVEVSTTGVNFTGTVTGIPGGTDTTYDFGAAGAAGNINFALTGSDASNDIVTMQAGTNITLTDNGSNQFTIDAAGGGGTSAPIVFTNGTVITHTGADPQGVLIDSILVPGGTITGGEVLKWECPLEDGPEGAFTYTSVLVSPNSPQNDPQYDWFLGRQSSGGGPDAYHWQRVMNVANDGKVYFIDTNGYQMPTFSPDGMKTKTPDWTLDQYFSIGIFIESPTGVWNGYSPSLTIFK